MPRWKVFSQDTISVLPLLLQALVSWSPQSGLWKVLRQWKEHRLLRLESWTATCYQWNSENFLNSLSLGFLTYEKGDDFIEGGGIVSIDVRSMTNTWRGWHVHPTKMLGCFGKLIGKLVRSWDGMRQWPGQKDIPGKAREERRDGHTKGYSTLEEDTRAWAWKSG